MLRFTRLILVAVVFVFGQVWVNLPAHLVKAEPNSYTLSGRVVEETEFGNSVSGASVNLSSLNGGIEQVAVSDTNGAYEFTSLSEGIYRLQIAPTEDTGFRYTSATVEVIEDTQFDLVVRESESSKARDREKP